MDKFVKRLGAKPTYASVSECPSTSAAALVSSVEKVSTSKLPTLKNSNTSRTSGGRSFQGRWCARFPWIFYDKTLDKVFCNVCREVFKTNSLPPSATSRPNDHNSLDSFVIQGFMQWHKAIERFKSHESGNFHRSCVTVHASLKKGSNVSAALNKSKLEEMQRARKALITITSSLRYLSLQGHAICGHTDESSNIHQLLLLRSEDVPELKSWLRRTKYKWTSHEILNEIISLLATDILENIVRAVKEAQYFALILDETADIANKEQISICLRYVDSELQIEETFLGFYETDSTTSTVLCEIVQDVLQRLNLNIQNCRGQCYDGAANVSGRLAGLQKLVKDLEPRALYIHCSAHNLNLVVQDTMQNVCAVRDFLTIVRELITFVKASPKRLAAFQSLQDIFSGNEEKQIKKYSALRPFCNTRWCVRVKSLKSLEGNYNVLLTFLAELSGEKNEVGAKASGFLLQMQDFKFVFLLKTLIVIFERVEEINGVLQSKSLCYRDVKTYVQTLISVLSGQRRKFSGVWSDVLAKARDLEIDEPTLPRVRKLPKRYRDGSAPHVFSSAEEMYRKMFFEIVDTASNSLETRFDSDALNFLSQCEEFAVGNASADEVVNYYSSDFDKERLILHRDMFLDMCKSKKLKVSNIADIINILTSSHECASMRNLLPEYVKFLTIMLTLPATSCTSERSFSALKRLKTYLRSTMTQKRLNNLAVLHIHRELNQAIDVNNIVNKFINVNQTRRNVFHVI